MTPVDAGDGADGESQRRNGAFDAEWFGVNVRVAAARDLPRNPVASVKYLNSRRLRHDHRVRQLQGCNIGLAIRGGLFQTTWP